MSAVSGGLVPLAGILPYSEVVAREEEGLEEYRLEWLDGVVEQSRRKQEDSSRKQKTSKRRSRGEEVTRIRADALLAEVHSGLSTLGTGIKVVTAILTVLGADRGDTRSEYCHLSCS